MIFASAESAATWWLFGASIVTTIVMAAITLVVSLLADNRQDQRISKTASEKDGIMQNKMETLERNQAHLEREVDGLRSIAETVKHTACSLTDFRNDFKEWRNEVKEALTRVVILEERQKNGLGRLGDVEESLRHCKTCQDSIRQSR